MKRIFTLFLSTLLILTLFSGCKEETGKKPAVSGKEVSSSQEKLQVLMEADIGGFHMYSNRKTTLSTYESKTKGFLDVIEELGGPKKKEVSLKFLPMAGTDRDQAMSQMQTEIMAGGGPDVFVSFAGTALEEPKHKSRHGITSAETAWEDVTPVIPYPQQAMERGMFLNLDDYLPKAQFMKLENLPEPLAKAGQYEGSQYILPMSYTVSLTCFDRAQVNQPELSETMTWEDMLEGDPVLKAAAGTDITSMWVGAPLWPLIEGENLSFTEEEFQKFVKEKLEAYQNLKSDGSAPVNRLACLNINVVREFTDNPRFPDCEIITMVPTYSRKGGYGALVKTYAAINANTERPDDAFFIVDYLLSEECQQSKYYEETIYARSVPSMTGEAVLVSFDDSEGKENHQTYCDLRKHIAFAELDTPLNTKIGDIVYQAQQDNGNHIESIVHDGYTRMKMLLDES